MAPTSPSSASAAMPKLPASADFNALYNRISLASAKQATFLTSMRAKYPSLARPASASTSATNPNNAAAGTFSSMSKPTTTTLPQPTASTRRAQADDAELRFENPNAGLGFATSKSDQATSAATRDLSRRLLGNKRGGRAADDPKALAAAALKKRRLQDDESDEEEGRSSLGNRKKKTKVRQEISEPEVLLGPPDARNDVEMRGCGSRDAVDHTKNDEDDKEDAPIPNPSREVIAPVDPAEEVDNRTETGEASKEKKKKKKKRNKENKKNKAAAAAAESNIGAAHQIPVA
ncbi:hypothetical protein CORC01_07007 [Colletotrichum orchidophilum]|uniref:Uncharacterized protein n=1 Tax=Colletotrichum orchidophilum TaxID=1209926 RepID=A0A1G4B8J4_9PEZI|nr:uncharacterized protein CORC01_07007 [Colletotrichum orchidophilum]OHE97592.1 hypothetical protein CORC01_07007 [Colletotrichum orchidophilum]